jgi:signal transduction histidine kinase
MLTAMTISSQIGVPDSVAVQRRTRRVLARVAVLLRVVALAPLVLAVLAGIHDHDYTAPWLAAATYLVYAVWTAIYVLTAWLRRAITRTIQVIDVAVIAGCVLLVAGAVRPEFFIRVSSSDFEPAMVVVAVTVAMYARPRWAVGACAVLVAAHVLAETPTTVQFGTGNLVNTISDTLWLSGAALLSGMIAHGLLAMASQVDVAAHEAAASQAALASERARLDERMRIYKERLRHYRTLHDGPLSILTAIATGGLDHNTDDVRRQCAINANLLRALIADDSTTSLSDLSMALTEAGSAYAVHGIRILYQFADVPADLPDNVVDALTGASREALNNVATHAGTDRAWLTVVAEAGPAVTVTITDRGKGFDPSATPPGRGIVHSIQGRLAEIGGTAAIHSHPGEGTRVDLRWQP